MFLVQIPNVSTLCSVLKPSGTMIVVSCAAPDARTDLFAPPSAIVATAAGLNGPGAAGMGINPAGEWYNWRVAPVVTGTLLMCSQSFDADFFKIFICRPNKRR